MKYLVEVDEKNRSGRKAMTLLKDLAKKENGITIRRSQIDEFESDTKMVKRMLRARKSGFIDTDGFLIKLKSQL